LFNNFVISTEAQRSGEICGFAIFHAARRLSEPQGIGVADILYRRFGSMNITRHTQVHRA
jgi:uncharacterized protein YuzE